MTTRSIEPVASERDSLLNNEFVEPLVRERTPWLLAFLCILIPILPSYSIPPGPLKSYGSPAKLIATGLFLLTVLGFVMVRRATGPSLVRPGAVLLVTYFFIWVVLYGVGAAVLGSPVVEANRTRAIVTLFANVGVGLYAVTRVETLRQRHILLGCLATGLTFCCVVGFLQNSTQIDLRLLFQPSGFVTNSSEQGVGSAPLLTERLGAKRASATSGHPIEFSVLAAIAVPLTIHFARYSVNRQTRFFAALATGIALIAMPAGVSRSGAIALVAALMVYVWTFKVRDLGLAVGAGAVALIAVFVASPNNVRALWSAITNASEDESILDRVADYARVSETFREHPAFGLGFGGAPPDVYGFLDNEWLQGLVQGGALGFFAMSLLALGGVFGVAAALRSANTSCERDLAYATGAAWTGILASSFTFDLFSYQQATLIFFLLFGLLWSSVKVQLAEAVPGFIGPGR